MISFKTSEDAVPSTLIVLSAIIVVGFLVYCLLYPVPDPSSVSQNAASQISLIKASTEKDQQLANVARSAISARVWTGDQNHIGTSVLGLVTDTTAANGVKLTAFRPQRSIALDGAVELPYSVQLSGPYPGVRSVMQALDSHTSRVVLKSVQVSASEEVTGSVTSTLVISAYMTNDPTIAANVATVEED